MPQILTVKTDKTITAEISREDILNAVRLMAPTWPDPAGCNMSVVMNPGTVELAKIVLTWKQSNTETVGDS